MIEKENYMKTLKNIIRIAEGWIKKYDFIYDVDGNEYHYDVVSRNKIEGTNLPDITNAVAIIPIFDNGDILMIREYRYPLNDYVWAFPAGLIDPGEDYETAAIRELKEETGINVKRIIRSYAGGFSSEGMTDEKIAIVVCSVEGELVECEGTEEVHPQRLSLEAVMQIASDPKNKVSNKVQLFLAGLEHSHSKN